MKLFFIILAVAGALLVAGILALMVPGIQRQIFLYYVEPLIDEVRLEYIEVRPFSAELSGLYWREGDGEGRIDSLRLEYSFGTFLGFFFSDAAEYDFESAHVDGFWLKLPPPDEEAPFDGVFGPLIFEGYIQVDRLDASGRVSMEEGEFWDIQVSGEGIGYGRMGNLRLAANPVKGEGLDQGLGFSFLGTLEIIEDVHRNPQSVIFEGEFTVEGDAAVEVPPMYTHLVLARTGGSPSNDEEIQQELYSLVLADSGWRTLVRMHGRLETASSMLTGEGFARFDSWVADVAPTMDLPVLTGEGNVFFSFHTLHWGGVFDSEFRFHSNELDRLHPGLDGLGPLAVEGSVSGVHEPGLFRLLALEAIVSDEEERGAVEVRLLRSIEIAFDAPFPRLQKVEGEFLHVDVSRLSLPWISLPWISPYFPNIDVEQGILSGAFSVGREVEEDALVARFTRPLRIEDLSVALTGEETLDGPTSSRPFLSAIDLDVEPHLSLVEGAWHVRYHNLDIRSEEAFLLAGEGEVTLLQRDPEGAIESSGDHSFALNNMADQPFARRWLDGRIIQPITLQSRHATFFENERLAVERLILDFRSSDESEVLRLDVTEGFTMDFAEAADFRRGFVDSGEVHIQANELPLYWYHQFVPEAAHTFGEAGHVSGGVRVRGRDGGILSTPEEPLRIVSLTLAQGGRSIVEELHIQLLPELFVSEDVIAVGLDDLLVSSGETNDLLLSGSLAGVFHPAAQEFPLARFESTFNANLVPLLRQPAALPDHRFVSGSTSGRVSISGDAWDVSLELRDVQGPDEDLLIMQATAAGSGIRRPDGYVEGSVPVTIDAESGRSIIDLVFAFIPESAAGEGDEREDELVLTFKSDRVRVTEFLRIGPLLGVEEEEIDVEELEGPFWEPVPFNVMLEVDVGTVVVTEEIAFNSVTGSALLTRKSLEIESLTAALGDEGSVFVDAVLSFNEEDRAYMLQGQWVLLHFHLDYLDAMVEMELSRNYPWPDGIFQVFLTVAGEGENLLELVRAAHLDLHVVGTGGIFHPFPAQTQLADEIRGATAAAGEFLSYLPTGGFGVGAVARFATYLHETPYDHLIVRAERRDDLDLRLLHFLLQSQHVRFSGEGRVVHEEGVPFLRQSLEIAGSLNAVGRAAAIIAQIGFIEGDRDEFGYFKGIDFEVWGTVSEPESNFDEIVLDAATGMIARGFFRPFSALISNLIYLRTTTDDPEPEEIDRLRRRRELGPTRRIF